MMRRGARAVAAAVAIAAAAAGAIAPASGQETEATRVVLVSFDGFRYDYLDRPEAELPNMREIAESTGVRSELLNAFTTKTFPNHYTLATGLYEESHGIVSNNFYDELHNDTFRSVVPSGIRPPADAGGTPTDGGSRRTRSMSRKESFWWDQGEPIWVTAERQGVMSATFFWPGSEVRAPPLLIDCARPLVSPDAASPVSRRSAASGRPSTRTTTGPSPSRSASTPSWSGSRTPRARG